MKIKRALISVSDKTGLEELARGLHAAGIELVSTGGTAAVIAQAGIPVIKVSDVTGFPEILGGRVKTLHPSIHGGILAMRTDEHLAQLDEHGITPIDMVVVNLYPFKATISKEGVCQSEAIENIDIGGPAMIRASAKNFKYVVVVTNPVRYDRVLDAVKKDEVTEELRMSLAREAFAHTAHYDSVIAGYLGHCDQAGKMFPVEISLPFELVQPLRYGENPHQKAAFYRDPRRFGASVANARQLHGKELSYNNILDLNSALELVREFEEPTVAIIKHNNPSGVASREALVEAYRLAYEADPVSAFGGIVAVNRAVDGPTAEEMSKIFLEAVIAPGFSEEALPILTKKAGIRLLETGPFHLMSYDWYDLRKVNGGLLVQEADRKVFNRDDFRVATKRQPTPDQLAELDFAFKIVKHVKSNAIVVTADRRLLGVGAGQMNRVGSARIALEQAGKRAKAAVLASDAFFPFNDTVLQAAEAGIAAIIQPGGSVRDQESIDTADEKGIVMVFTGMRHFKH